mmetsp:Transcript_11395/g.22356  ORF Transcript_11395/g.22356 Transcript_11395/m.22356 type:complete len:401 (-) Transcript_11395:768-1970(-)
MKPSNGKASSQQVVRYLFSLPDEEDVLDDFSCALKRKISIHGRLFCTDNYLCFYANILGFKTKQVIPFKEVVSIKKHKGMSNTIEIACTNGKSYFLNSFIRAQDAFQFIYSLWRNSGYFNDENDDVGNWSDTEENAQEEEEKNSILSLPADDIGDAVETFKGIIPVSPQKFFDLFFAEEAVYPFNAYCVNRGDTELEITNWVENEELGGYTREMKFRTKINGPSIGPKSTRCHRVQNYKFLNNSLVIKTSSKALDVPYSSYFLVEDEWVITEVAPDKSLFRTSVYVNFLKSTIFKGKIESRTHADVAKDVEAWVSEVKSRKLIQESAPIPQPTATEQPHLIAKYDPVDLKIYQKRPSFLNVAPIRPTQSRLLYGNFALLIVAFLYLAYLHSKLNSLKSSE